MQCTFMSIIKHFYFSTGKNSSVITYLRSYTYTEWIYYFFYIYTNAMAHRIHTLLYKWNTMRQFRDIEGQWPTINSEVNIYS